MLNYTVSEIPSYMTRDFILNKHYAGRLPSISIAYGLFNEEKLVGCLTIGKPASNNVCKGLFGEEYSSYVYELNRLVVDEGLDKNTLSYFVGSVLKRLKDTTFILVSYADTAMGHHGYIYQATNWYYLGATKARTDGYVPGGKHSRHYSGGYNHLRKLRSSKHKYLYIPNKKLRKECLNLDCTTSKLMAQNNYPKGNNGTYILGEKMKEKVLNMETGEVFYE